ncbi:T9SS type A sorting domain-containing protein [Halocola ammonii]
MIRFLFFLFIFFPVLIGNTQNLIPNPSGENFIECPETLNALETSSTGWINFRGSPDYFNSCSESPYLGINNSLGYQPPRTGEAYMGGLTYHIGLPQEREYLGVELTEPLTIGEIYHISFYISVAFREETGIYLASNNLGCLFMVNNYLDSDEFGNIPNFSHYNFQELSTDTLNWINHSFTFVADSAYQYVAFGNFYDDDNTTIEYLAVGEGNAGAYVFYDDFCISQSKNECEVTNYINKEESILEIYPNPASQFVSVYSTSPIISVTLIDMQGMKHEVDIQRLNSNDYKIIPDEFASGTYILHLNTEKEIFDKRIMITK